MSDDNKENKDDNLATYHFVTSKLRLSKETQDKLLAYFKDAQSVVIFLKSLPAYIGIASDFVQSVINFFNPKPSDFDILYKNIVKALQDVINEVDLGDKHNLALFVDTQVGNINDCYKAVQNYLTALENNGTIPDDILIQLDDHLTISGNAVSILQTNSYWHRLYNKNAVCDLKWGEGKYDQPKEEDGLVWDYRFALPALLHGISVRLLILKTKNPDYTNDYRLEISDNANWLYNNVYRKICDGITKTPAPILKEVTDANKTPHPYPDGFSNFWEWKQGISKACGAVEIFSGLSYVETLPFEQPSKLLYFETINEYLNALGLNPATGTPAIDKNAHEHFEMQHSAGIEANKKLEQYNKKFYLLFAIRAERAWQKVFNELSGLPQLWATIYELKQLIGEPFPKLPYEQGYSIRRVVESPLITSAQPYHKEEPVKLHANVWGSYSVRNLADIVDNEEFEFSETFPWVKKQTAISLRKIFAGN